LDIELPCEPAIPLIGVYSKELKTGTQIVYMSVLSSIIQNSQNNPDVCYRWINEMWPSHKMEVRRNEVLMHATNMN
jgi:hypothetical protein